MHQPSFDNCSDEELLSMVKDIKSILLNRKAKRLIEKIEESPVKYVLTEDYDEKLAETIFDKGYNFGSVSIPIKFSGYKVFPDYNRKESVIFKYLNNVPSLTLGDKRGTEKECFITIYSKPLPRGSGLVFDHEYDSISLLLRDQDKYHVFVQITVNIPPNGHLTPWIKELKYNDQIKFIKFDEIVLCYSETLINTDDINNYLYRCIALKYYPS